MDKQIAEAFPRSTKTQQGRPLVYLDHAATTPKPRCVIEAIASYYEAPQANVYRSTHQLAGAGEAMVEATRCQVGDFLGGATREEVIFTSGTTASLNLVAHAYGGTHLGPGDEVLVSVMEHHSNYLPWHAVCAQRGARLRTIPLQKGGILDQQAYQALLNPRTKVVALTYVSNVLGVVNPLQAMITAAHAHGAVVVVDAAQAVPHLAVDVKVLDCDFLAFSSHKTYGPTGIGILYGKQELLQQLPPPQLGGGMVSNITAGDITYDPLPHRLEAGTPHLAGIAGLGAALTFLQEVGQPQRQAHEKALTTYLQDGLASIPGLHIMGEDMPERIGIIPFTMAHHHPLDIGVQLDLDNIALRIGSLCAIPLMKALGIPSAVRVSLGLSNTTQDIDRLITTLHNITSHRSKPPFPPKSS